DGKLWDLAGRKERFSFKTTELNVAFAPDGKTLAVPDGESLKLLKVATGEEQRRFRAATQLLAYAPDGRTIALTWFAGPLQLRDAVSGNELRTTEKTEGDNRWLLAFALDGNSLWRITPQGAEQWEATLESKRRAWLWDVPERKAAALAPDGRHVAIAS